MVEIGCYSLGERTRETGTRNVRKGFGEPFAVKRRTGNGSDYAKRPSLRGRCPKQSEGRRGPANQSNNDKLTLSALATLTHLPPSVSQKRMWGRKTSRHITVIARPRSCDPPATNRRLRNIKEKPQIPNSKANLTLSLRVHAICALS